SETALRRHVRYASWCARRHEGGCEWQHLQRRAGRRVDLLAGGQTAGHNQCARARGQCYVCRAGPEDPVYRGEQQHLPDQCEYCRVAAGAVEVSGVSTASVVRGVNGKIDDSELTSLAPLTARSAASSAVLTSPVPDRRAQSP